MKWVRTHSASRAAIVAVCAVVTCSLAACGTPATKEPVFDPLSTVIVPDSTLAAQVPPEIRADGMLTIATDPTYPPMEFTDGARLRGADIDLGRAIASTLDLAPGFRNAQFSNIVPLVAVDTYELGISALWADNETATLANMVTYLRAGIRLAGRKGRTAPANNSLGMCGHSVSVEEGTEYIDTLVKLSATCQQLGLQPIAIVATADQDEATALLTKGKVNSMIADSPAVTYAVSQSNGKLVAIGGPVDVRPYGIATSQTYPKFSQVVAQALQRLIDSGVYGRILDSWGLGSNKISEPQVLLGNHTELLEMSSAAPSR